MKKLILPLLSLSLLISACSKDDDKAPKEMGLTKKVSPISFLEETGLPCNFKLPHFKLHG